MAYRKDAFASDYRRVCKDFSTADEVASVLGVPYGLAERSLRGLYNLGLMEKDICNGVESYRTKEVQT